MVPISLPDKMFTNNMYTTRSFIKLMTLFITVWLILLFAILSVIEGSARVEAVEVLEGNYAGQMKVSDAESIIAIITAEGFDQAFSYHYSTYKDINDTKFHDLRKAYIAASKELIDYVVESTGKVDNIPYYFTR